MKVSFIGLGYIGLPTAAIVAKNDIEVLGVDINQEVVDTVNKGETHIVEPNLKEYVQSVVSNGKLRASTQVEKSDVFVVVVPTPFKNNNEPDISYVEAATRDLLPFLEKGNLFIIESTSPVGTTNQMAEIIYAERPELKGELYMAYCPERILPGNAIHELVYNDRVIGGVDEQSADKAIDFYKQFVKGELHKTNSQTAEMCKLTENSYRDVNIAFANELSIICDEANINVWELIQLANKHPRVEVLQPGSGVGGHCIAVDPWFIVSKFPTKSKLIKQAREGNDYKAKWCAEKIINESFRFEKEHGRWPVISCMGLAFKPNIDDLRESPAKGIVQDIIKSSNNDNILICEPNIESHNLYKLVGYKEAYQKADIVAFLVAHDEFKSIEKDQHKIELDFCGVRK